MTAPSTTQQSLEQLANGAQLCPWHGWLFLIWTGGTFINGHTTLMTGVAFPLLNAQEHPNAVTIGS
ncbi:MAG: hypothetical protein QUV06_10065 [Cyanobium sp. CZS 48M]|nr:hypothetical protein [Cyanobium sp. CZS48M]